MYFPSNRLAPLVEAMVLAGYCCNVCCYSPTGAISPSSHPQCPGILERLGSPVSRSNLPRCPLQLSLGSLFFFRLLPRSSVWPECQKDSDFYLLSSLRKSLPYLEVTGFSFFPLWNTGIISSEGLSFHKRQKRPLTSSFLLCKTPEASKILECLKWEGGKILRVNYLLKYYPVCSFLNK